MTESTQRVHDLGIWPDTLSVLPVGGGEYLNVAWPDGSEIKPEDTQAGQIYTITIGGGHAVLTDDLKTGKLTMGRILHRGEVK